MSLLLKNAQALVGKEQEVRVVDIRIDGDRISEIGVKLEHRGEEILHASKFFVMPGLVNAHLHPSHALSKGLTDGVSWEEGLLRLYTLDREKTNDDRYIGSLLGFAEAVLSGTTSASVLSGNIEGESRAAQEIGIRVVLAKTYSNFWVGDGVGPRQMSIAEIEAEFRAAHADKTRDRTTVHFGISHEVGADDQLFLLAKRLSEELHIRTTIHAAENREFIRKFRNAHRIHPILYFQNIGFLGPWLTLVHMTQTRRPDVLSAIAQSGTAIAHCPVSNTKLTDGFFALRAMRERGIVIGLGTDASLNNNTNNLLSEMYVAALLHNGIHYDPGFLSPSDVIHMATLGSAATMGMADDIGAIDVGRRADLIFFDQETPGMTPSVDPRSNLVFNAPDLRPQHVFIAGKWVVQDYQLKTVDLSQIINEARARTKKIHTAFQQVVDPPRVRRAYIAGSLTRLSDPAKKDFYNQLAETAKNFGFDPYVPHHRSDPQKNPDLTPEDVLEMNMDLLTDADILIAYVGEPSLGTGMELMFAWQRELPIILLYEKEARVSRMARAVVPSVHQIAFEAVPDALARLGEILSKIS
jgi:cytosine/adenosine deaminase-related metal-dependent hydrolase/nucleoside 2-deoxyribosyltransferase